MEEIEFERWEDTSEAHYESVIRESEYVERESRDRDREANN